MKIKIKTYLKLGILLFGILFLWFSCEKDPNDSEAPKHQLVEINYYDINQLPGVENALSKSQCAIIMTQWKQYEKLNNNEFKYMTKKFVIDCRRVLVKKQLDVDYFAIGLGKKN